MCHFLHAFADCVLELRERHEITPERVRSIRCFISPDQLHIVCEPASVKRAPRTTYEAKFSIYYCLALALIDGAVGIGSFSPDQIQRADVLDLARRVEYVRDPGSAFPTTFPGRVEIELTDGTTLAQEYYEPRGSRGRLPTDAELETKFRDAVGSSGLKADVDELLAAVAGFTGPARVADLLARFVPASDEVRSY
jgi:2-methylcitrate dehydratase PrpD